MLQECEEELKELRTLKANAKKMPKPQPKPKLGVQARSNNVKNENCMIDVVDEHEEFMDELLRKLNGDEQVSDPFKAIVAVENFPIHDDKTNWRMKKPILSEKYVNAKQFKDCLTYYALANGFSLWYHRSSEKEVIAKCGQRPPRLKNPDAGKKGSTTGILVWVRVMNQNVLGGALWIGKEFGDKIRANPNIRLVDITDLVLKKYKCTVTPNQCSKAKTWALSEYDKSIQQHYALLRSYGDELLTSNPGSTVKIGVTQNRDEKVYFDRFYVCLNGLKKGWKRGCRRIIALDGCFLKKPNQGELLTAIGRDGNNHIYPIAWAVVSVENKDNWTWFLELLAGDLEINGGVGITLMSDQHKGFWTTHFSGGYEFEVRQKSEAFKVDEKMRTCSCRMWQLSGLPCPHACSAIFAMGKSPEDYIPAWFRKDMYIGTYSTYLRPVDGISCWVPNNLNKPLPPQPKKKPGMPKRKRRRAAHEGGSGVRIPKTGVVMTCQLCHEEGHNKRGCKNVPKDKPVKVSKPVGRPRKDGRPSGAQSGVGASNTAAGSHV
ncbi:uncharacterized protein [Rutidosis leptorrhynchoides]|uniref:uncharacterized protein n=1 Tax=Rutidosis leptorrhynchoides TaxID=125765 RepID=UPI003A995F2C